MTMANGRCESDPIPRDRAAGSNPTLATNIVIMIGRSRCTDPSIAESSIECPLDAKLIDVFHHDDTGLHRDAEERQKTYARRHAEVSSSDKEGEQSADGRHGDVARISSDPFDGVEHSVQNHEDHQNRQRQNDSEPLLRSLLAFVLARPIDAYNRWEASLAR